MKAIVISEASFKQIFEQCLAELELARLKHGGADAKFENSEVGQMHRTFHYHVVMLKERLRDG